ncbi:hypothetical protein BGW41_001813 [Actinomortierella wolfii]|nr:hypothetical protein BGW41_001813 [Actinomortierella wolfii]
MVLTDDFKRWMTRYFTEDKAARKLSFRNIIKRRRTQLQTSGVIKGSRIIQSGMDLLAPDGCSTILTAEEMEESPYSLDGESQTSPCVARQTRIEMLQAGGGNSNDKGERRKESGPNPMMSSTRAKEEVKVEFPDPTLGLEHFAALGQAIVWNINGIDMVQKFRDFRPGNLGPFSLARDGIADLTHESTFSQALDPTLLSVARRADPAPDIYERWPTLRPIFERVFMSNHYDEVASAVRSESMHDPIAAYLFVVIMAYWQYFQFHEEIPENINEREGFSGLHGQYADAVAIYNNQQLLLAEASLIHFPKLDKGRRDEFKLARAMRDSWISQVRSICNLAVPPRGLAMFGSLSFKGETKLLRMDFQGVFRLQQFDLFTIPLSKRDFGNKMKAAAISSLELAARLHQEIERRRQPASILGYNDRAPLSDALRQIEKTTPTPTKSAKRNVAK